ncbi:MAG: hypothetical protein ACYSUN_01665 [Planctomycetota bacterium]|jgi:hypothetical protein
MKERRTLLAGCALLVVAGCTSIGPGTVARDQFNYASALSQAWKDQMLLNLVKIRYADAPVFLDLTSVISQYTLEGTVTAAAPPYESFAVSQPTVGVGGRWADRPTISYTPMSGEKFTRSLMTPIRPDVLFFLIQAGWPADFIFRIIVKTINGVQNYSGAALLRREEDPKFEELLVRLRKLQMSESVGTRIEKKEKMESSILFFRKDPDPETMAEGLAVRKLLNLDPETEQFDLVYGALARSKREIAVLSRSMLEMMVELGTQIDVPPQDVKDGRTLPGLRERADDAPAGARLIRVASGNGAPSDAFVTVSYRGHDFWIEDTDFRSKRMFTLLMILFSLAEGGEKGTSPVLTVSAGP